MEGKNIYRILIEKKTVRSHQLNGESEIENSLGFIVKVYNQSEDKLEKTYSFIRPWEARRHKEEMERDLSILSLNNFEKKYQIR